MNKLHTLILYLFFFLIIIVVTYIYLLHPILLKSTFYFFTFLFFNFFIASQYNYVNFSVGWWAFDLMVLQSVTTEVYTSCWVVIQSLSAREWFEFELVYYVSSWLDMCTSWIWTQFFTLYLHESSRIYSKFD